jgi:hypothetical protein
MLRSLLTLGVPLDRQSLIVPTAVAGVVSSAAYGQEYAQAGGRAAGGQSGQDE